MRLRISLLVLFGLGLAAYGGAQARHYKVSVEVLPHLDLNEKEFVEEQLWLQRQGGMSKEQSDEHKKSIEKVAKKRKSGFSFQGDAMVRLEKSHFWLWRPSPILDLENEVIFEKFDCFDDVTVKQMDRAMPRVFQRRPVLGFETVAERAFLLKERGDKRVAVVQPQDGGPSYKSTVEFKDGFPLTGFVEEIAPDGTSREVYEYQRLSAVPWSFSVRRSEYSVETYIETVKVVPDLSILALGQSVADERLLLGQPVMYKYQGSMPTLAELQSLNAGEQASDRDTLSPLVVAFGLLISVGGATMILTQRRRKH